MENSYFSFKILCNESNHASEGNNILLKTIILRGTGMISILSGGATIRGPNTFLVYSVSI